MTTIADIKKAASNARRVGYQINKESMTHAESVGIWLREIMLLEARIRSYAREHGVGSI